MKAREAKLRELAVRCEVRATMLLIGRRRIAFVEPAVALLRARRTRALCLASRLAARRRFVGGSTTS
jgi:hypothetical protein